MTDIPIIFSAPMIRALLEGRKTMTRRLAYKPWVAVDDLASELQEDYELRGRIFHHRSDGSVRAWTAPSSWQKVRVGDRLWVRESGLEHRHVQLFTFDATPGNWWSAEDGGRYGAGYNTEAITRDVLLRNHRVRPSIHMPRWASRLTLIVTATKIEWLQEISDADAKAEGAYKCENGWTFSEGATLAGSSAPGAFYCLWRSLHGDGAWEANPQVRALTFTVHKQNIDTMK